MSETEMVVRVAKAMLADLERSPKDGGEHGCLFEAAPDLHLVIRGHVDLKSLARAAIAAMREPSDAMLNVFHDRIVIECRPASRDAEVKNDAEVWAAAIDAALAEPGGEG